MKNQIKKVLVTLFNGQETKHLNSLYVYNAHMKIGNILKNGKNKNRY